jgi:hypothetical protein
MAVRMRIPIISAEIHIPVQHIRAAGRPVRLSAADFIQVVQVIIHVSMVIHETDIVS